MRSNRLFFNNPVDKSRRNLSNTIAKAIAIFYRLPSEVQTLALAAAALSVLPGTVAQDRTEIIKTIFFRDQNNTANYYAKFYDNEGNTEYSIDLDTIIGNFTSQCNMTVVSPGNLTDFTYIAGYRNMYDIILNGVDFFRKTGNNALDFFENCFEENAQQVFHQTATENNLGYYAILAIMMLILIAGCAGMLFQMRDGIGCCQTIMYYNDPILRAYRSLGQDPEMVDVEDQKQQEEKIVSEGGYPVTVIIDDDQKEQAPVQPVLRGSPSLLARRGSPSLLARRDSPLSLVRRASPLRTFSVINTELQQPLLSDDEGKRVDEVFSPMTPTPVPLFNL